MNGRLVLASLFGIVIVACLLAPVEAAIHYRYAFYNETDVAQTNFLVDPGDTVTVKVYLEEYGDSGDTSLLKSQGGLIYAGVKITFADPDTSTARASVTNLADISLNTLFDDGGAGHKFAEGGLVAPDDETAVLWDSNVLDPYSDSGWLTTVSSSSFNKVYLGSFTFTAGAPGDTTLISAEDPNIPSGSPVYPDDIVTDLGTSLDGTYGVVEPQGAIITTNEVIPEPATGLIWIGLTGLFALTGRIRRKGSGCCDRS